MQATTAVFKTASRRRSCVVSSDHGPSCLGPCVFERRIPNVAEVDRITAKESTNLMTVLEQGCKTRSSKTSRDIADVQPLDDSEVKPDRLAIVTASVFGRGEIKLLKENSCRQVFFLLAVSCPHGKLPSVIMQRNLRPQLPIVPGRKV